MKTEEQKDRERKESNLSVVVEHGGKLFIADPWNNLYTKPEQYRPHWPTGVFTSDFGHLLGQFCKYVDAGLYRTEDGLMIALEYRGETKPSQEYSERREIKKPRWAKEYKNGQWQRR